MISKEDIIKSINFSLEEFASWNFTAQESVEYEANKIEGAIGLAYTVGAISASDYKAMCCELSNIKWDKQFDICLKM